MFADETLDKETDVPDLNPNDLGGVRIDVYKRSKSERKTLSERDFQAEMRRYEARSAVEASKVDPKSYTKDGITHKIR
jgi:hypothetical protein